METPDDRLYHDASHARGLDGTPLPRVEEVIARLDKARAAIKNLSVTTEHIKLQNDDLPVSEPIRLRRTTAFIVDRAAQRPKRS